MIDQAQKLREMVSATKHVENQNKRRAFTYCITSGKGGVGKTSFTVNYALALAACDKKVAIIDADFGFSNVNILLGVNTKYHLGHLISGERALSEVMRQCHENVWYISGGTGVDELMHLDLAPQKLEYALEQLRALEGMVDYIIFDTGAGMSDAILRIIEASDRTVLVLTSEPASILDSYVVVKTTAQLRTPPHLSVLVNKAVSEKDAVETYRNFSNIVIKYLKYDLDMLGYVSQDNKMGDSVAKLVPHIIKHPSSPAAKQIQWIADRVTKREGEKSKDGGFRGFFNRLTKRG